MKRAVVEERFEYKGFSCVVIMQLMGFRTGYVGLPKGNKYYGKPYDEMNMNCNGGLTYSENYLFGQEDTDLWWVGFDAGHFFNGYDVEALKKLFSDDTESMKQISIMESTGMFSISENLPMSLEDMKRDCMGTVDQILQESEVSE